MSGSVEYTADGVVGPSGAAVRVYNATWLSGTTAGDFTLRTGTTTAGDVIVQEPGAADHTETINFERGLLFPDGCYVDFDANTTRATIEFRTEM